jgi:hypothetical protein
MMAREDEDERTVNEAWRAVVLGRCWYVALLLATGQHLEAEIHLIAITDRLPLRDSWWC